MISSDHVSSTSFSFDLVSNRDKTVIELLYDDKKTIEPFDQQIY